VSACYRAASGTGTWTLIRLVLLLSLSRDNAARLAAAEAAGVEGQPDQVG
jgi:hypothetical protein